MTDARPCRACGIPLEFRVGPKGKTLPLQRVRKVYAIDPNGEVIDATEALALAAEAAGEPPTSYWISHFEACPKASEFSGGRKR
jgi:hypothetical protein